MAAEAQVPLRITVQTERGVIVHDFVATVFVPTPPAKSIAEATTEELLAELRHRLEPQRLLEEVDEDGR